jgi:hypothetical protein
VYLNFNQDDKEDDARNAEHEGDENEEDEGNARTSASIRYPDWYALLEWYVSYGVYQAERAVEGIGRLERRMDDFAHVQMEMQASIDSQTSMMHDLFGHFGINPGA